MREKAIQTPKELNDLFNEYVAWAKSNPFKWHDYVGKDAEEVWKLRERPLTWMGFEGFLASEGVVTQLTHYERNPTHAEFLPVIRAIKAKCRQDTIDGAMAGVYQQNIAARIEGLVDKQQSETDGKVQVTVKYERRDNNAPGTSPESD